MSRHHVEIKGSELSRLVQKQMRNWELSRAQHIGKASPRKQVADFICISRQLGAGGEQIAADVGRRLGWGVFGKELLQHMAGDAAARKSVYAVLDERETGWIESMLRSLMDSKFVRDDYFRRLGETVLALARKGNAVFIGRGIDMILPADAGLRVRIIAPLEERIRRVAEREKLGATEARQKIERVEADRAAFIRRHFGVEADDAERYDLVMNTARLTPADAVEIILRAHERVADRDA